MGSFRHQKDDGDPDLEEAMVEIDPGSHRFDVTVLNNKSGSDSVRVPANATIKILEPGATAQNRSGGARYNMARSLVGSGRLRGALLGFAMACVALCAGPRPANAQFIGIDLSWDDCGLAGVLNKDFACDTNDGVSVLVPSVGLVGGTPLYVRSVIVFLFDGATPSWWALQPAGCRAGAVTVTAGAPGLTGCVDYWGTRPSSLLFNWGVVTDNGSPIGYGLESLVWTTPEFAEPVADPTEIYSGVIRIDNRKTAGADSCSGCGVQGGFTYLQATIETVETPGEIIRSPIHREYVLWQNGTVPTRRPTWGAVKALYR